MKQQKTDVYYNRFFNIRKETIGPVRQTKRNDANDQLFFQENNTRKFYRTFTAKLGYQPQNLCFKKKDQNLAHSNEDNCNELAKYLKKYPNFPQPTYRCPTQQTYKANLNSCSPMIPK